MIHVSRVATTFSNGLERLSSITRVTLCMLRRNETLRWYLKLEEKMIRYKAFLFLLFPPFCKKSSLNRIAIQCQTEHNVWKVSQGGDLLFHLHFRWSVSFRASNVADFLEIEMLNVVSSEWTSEWGIRCDLRTNSRRKKTCIRSWSEIAREPLVQQFP